MHEHKIGTILNIIKAAAHEGCLRKKKEEKRLKCAGNGRQEIMARKSFSVQVPTSIPCYLFFSLE